MIINGIEVDRDKFIGRMLVSPNGKVEVVTQLSNGEQSTGFFTWQQIKATVEEVLRERAADAGEETR